MTPADRPSSVALATFDRLPNLDPDEHTLLAAFEALGLRAVPAIWSDSEIDWAAFGVVLIRNTWDYHRRLPDFLAWIDHVASVGDLLNPPDLVRWNVHKRYLFELQERGVPVIPCELVEAGTSARALAGVVARHGWGRAFVKPAVSAGADGAREIDGESGVDSPWLAALLRDHDVLVQPFVPEIATDGERSLVFVDGDFSHAFDRAPGTTQTIEVHSAAPARPSVEELRFAERALEAVPEGWSYARVDMVRGSLLLTEIELIEPSLYFGAAPDPAAAARRLAVVCQRRIESCQRSSSIVPISRSQG